MLITSSVKKISDLVSRKPGAVFAYPTETFYGLGCGIKDDAAIERILSIKGRDAAKGMIVLVNDIFQAESIAVINKKQRALLRQFWPGPLSVILIAADGLNPLLAPEGRIALRVSPHDHALELTGCIGPIVSTSANPTGKVPSVLAVEVKAYDLEIDAILDGGRTPGGLPSTLADLTGENPICLRPGVIPFENVLECWKKLE